MSSVLSPSPLEIESNLAASILINNPDNLSKGPAIGFSQIMIKDLIHLGLTKQLIAKKLEVSESTVQRILNGQIKTPKHHVFNKLLTLYCTATIK